MMILLIITLLIISQDGELTTSQGTLAQDALSKRAARGTSLTLRGVGKSKRRRGQASSCFLKDDLLHTLG